MPLDLVCWIPDQCFKKDYKMLKIESKPFIAKERDPDALTIGNLANNAGLNLRWHGSRVLLCRHQIPFDLMIFDDKSSAIKYLKSLDKNSAPERI